MGRPYATELSELDDTYHWSRNAPVDELSNSIVDSATNYLLAVGSGGSLTAAHYASFLHTRFCGRASQVLTPYELVGSTQTLHDTSVLILSAGGSNPDVLACAVNVAERQPNRLFAITTRTETPLGGILSDLSWPYCHTFVTPTRKDGFLATNSLLATIVLLTRAYEKAFNVQASLPDTLDELLHPSVPRSSFVEARDGELSALCNRQTLIVLHGRNSKPAAADIESRFTEAALGNVQTADFRNFAHGRHHWLAKHYESSAVLALSSHQDKAIAERTLALLPKTIPQLHIVIGDGAPGAIAAICESMFLARAAGIVKDIDPGRPHVPTFGRKLYHLKGMPAREKKPKLSERAATAIERKSGLAIETLVLRQELDRWTLAYEEFLSRLQKAAFRAVVFDYDGTLCGVNRRFDGPTDEFTKELQSLLKAGVVVAIATGRGKSVREALEKVIKSSELRKRVVIGYHNAGEIGTLADPSCPPDKSPLHESLKEFEELLRSDRSITDHVRLQAKGRQITLELGPGADRHSTFELVASMARQVAVKKMFSTARFSRNHLCDVCFGKKSQNVLR